jgi:hypothetical protein
MTIEIKSCAAVVGDLHVSRNISLCLHDIPNMVRT